MRPRSIAPSLEQVARLEAQEESLAARLLAVETSAEEQKRHYERRLRESADLLKQSKHELSVVAEEERGSHESQVISHDLP